MPVLRISDATFADLSTLKTWLGTKTPSETIDHVMREAMEQFGIERDVESDVSSQVSEDGIMDFLTAPGLTFAKPLAATIDGKALRSPRWSALLLQMIAHVKAKGIEGDKLVHELQVPSRVGCYEEEGFKYQQDLGISVQGQSASDAWKEIDRIAQKWRLPVTVEFWWRRNAKAQHPGRTGRLRSGGA